MIDLNRAGLRASGVLGTANQITVTDNVNGTITLSLAAGLDALVYKGATDCSTNPNYPAADAGHCYKVSVAGKIGGGSGLAVQVGDMYICTTDGTLAGTQAERGANWNIIQANLDFATDAETVIGTEAAKVTSPANITARLAAPGPIGGTTPAAGIFTSVNGLIITSTLGTLTIPNNANAQLITSGNYSITLTATEATNVTLPLTGTLYGTATGSITSAQLLASLSDETGTGVAVFGTAPTITNPIIANINPGADFTLTQNSVAALTSVNAGAIVNTLYASGGKVGLHQTTWGTSASKVLALGNGTAPTTSPADAVQLWSADRNSVGGAAVLHMRTEDGLVGPIAIRSEIDSSVNSKMPSQAVNMTAGTSSTGITVADNANINFGTGNFTLVWRGSLPTWPPAENTRLFSKIQDSENLIYVTFRTDSTFDIYIKVANVVILNSVGTTGYVLSLSNGAVTEIAISVIRETATTAGSVSCYINGVQFAPSVAITAAATVSISNTGPLYVLGINTDRFAGRTEHGSTFNRALTAAEVLDLYRNGVSFSDRWGSQTELMPNQVDRDFSGASAWANVDLNAYDETGDLTITATAANQYCTLPVASAPTTANKKYRMTFDVANIVSTWTIKSFDGTQIIGTVTANGTGQRLEWTASTTGGYRIVAVANDSSADFDNFTLVEIGATLALEPEGIGLDKWFDATSNGLNATYPTAGATLARPIIRPAKQGTITAGGVGAVTVTIAMMLGGIITANPDTARAYTFETGATSDTNGRLTINDAFEWVIVNTNGTNAVTVTASDGHTVVGNMVVALSTSGRFRTIKTAASTFVTYRLN